MSIELPKARDEAIVSIMRYFKENMDDPIGNIAAGGLLGYFLEEIGPLVYNKAVADVQERLQMRVLRSTLKFMRMNSSTGASTIHPEKENKARHHDRFAAG